MPVAAPGQRFIYSDINFFLLGELVARISGQGLDAFARTHIFEPLGMRETTFLPPAALRPSIAPTESCAPLAWPCGGPTERCCAGVVHDPTARRMGGVAGHAGLFSTAADLSRFCRMLLKGGTLDGVRVLSPLTVALMTRPATPPALGQVRGLGWDIDSRYAVEPGCALPDRLVRAHRWTGPSLWIDPTTRMFVVFLANRVHPDGKGDVVALRGRVATVVAAALAEAAPPRDMRLVGGDFGAAPAAAPPVRMAAPVLNGIDVLAADQFAILRGKRVGLVTNHTGRSRDGRSTIDVLRAAPGSRSCRSSAPSTASEASSMPRFPHRAMRRRGCRFIRCTAHPPADGGDARWCRHDGDRPAGRRRRFYTYIATMAYVMEEAAKRSMAVVVLDRPNPSTASTSRGRRTTRPPQDSRPTSRCRFVTA